MTQLSPSAQKVQDALRDLGFNLTVIENATSARTAQEAAGTIHSDMARGFIRAEVIQWEDLVRLGGLSEARAAGSLRVEGKDYLPTDGEVIHIRFNV